MQEAEATFAAERYEQKRKGNAENPLHDPSAISSSGDAQSNAPRPQSGLKWSQTTNQDTRNAPTQAQPQPRNQAWTAQETAPPTPTKKPMYRQITKDGRKHQKIHPTTSIPHEPRQPTNLLLKNIGRHMPMRHHAQPMPMHHHAHQPC